MRCCGLRIVEVRVRKRKAENKTQGAVQQQRSLSWMIGWLMARGAKRNSCAKQGVN
jgi:hypothetical protein